MSKSGGGGGGGFDYSKWDKIELSDDEDDVHPNIDKESWFRMRHRSRVEREGNEAKDQAQIQAAMQTNNQRIKIIQHELGKLKAKPKEENDDDDDDDDLDDREGLETELYQLLQENKEYQEKLDDYIKNKKWNVDNMFQVKEERTLVTTATPTYNPESGYAVEKKVVPEQEPSSTTTTSEVNGSASTDSATTPSATLDSKNTMPSAAKSVVAAVSATSAGVKETTTTMETSKKSLGPAARVVGPTPEALGAMETYHDFTERHAETVEQFMTACPTLEDSKEFLLKFGDVLLCENASNYLLLASLEDEMNGHRDKMKRTARQSQIVSSLAELAKTVHQHPGNVILPFFARLQERKHLEDFLAGVAVFVEKIIQRAVVKKAEIDAQRQQADDADAATTSTDLHDIPRDERLGPGGLDPLEVIETLPSAIVEAFESRDVEQLKAVLQTMEPDEAEHHMKRCVASGLWVAN